MKFWTNNNLVNFLGAYLKGRGRGFLLVCGYTLALGLTEGFGLLLILPILENLGSSGVASGNGSLSRVSQVLAYLGVPLKLPVLLLVFVLLVSLRALLTSLSQIHDNRLQLAFLTELRNRFFRVVTYTNWVFFSKTRSSDLIQTLTTDLNRVGMGANHLGRLIGSTLMAAVYTLLALSIAPLVSLVAGAAGLALILLLRRGMIAAREAGAELTNHQNSFFAVAGEHLQGMKVVKSFGLERHHIQRFEATTAAIQHQIINFFQLQTRTRMFLDIGAVILLASVVYFGAARTAGNELLILIILYARIMPRISSLVGDFQQLLHMVPAWVSARDTINRCLNAAENLAEETSEQLSLGRDIRFESVHFSYKGPESKAALSGIDLCLPARCTTAIIGPSGAGKSTLADLIMGLVLPDSGSILIDGKPLSKGTIHTWRRVLGYVPQETWLFNGTIRANLEWAAPQADDKEIASALNRASATDFVAQLAEGLETLVGDRGVLLSGGERQRLALARALLRKPELLILDEATSALDLTNENNILRAIDELHGGITIVLIAHRLSTVQNADYLVVLDKGRVVEKGWRKSLLEDAQSHYSMMLQRDTGEVGPMGPRTPDP